MTAGLGLGVVAILGGIYVVRGLVGSAHVAAAKNEAWGDLAAALPSGKRRATAERERSRATLDRVGAPAYSWQELVCELETNDVGWIADEYVQQCDIRSIDLVSVTEVEADPGTCEYLYIPEAVEATRSGTVGYGGPVDRAPHPGTPRRGYARSG